ncbi:hypothetical protein [Phenylobacterium sp.]|jgi:hypothetical protein|uniref:hypothetical protein n=1 Tax=Phenylobacterium sp. TaxID=1871053 RepID=UPI002F924BCE
MIGCNRRDALAHAGSPCDTRSQMPLPLTLTLIAVLAALVAFAGWRGARPPDLVKGPRLVPWRAIMVTGAAVLLLLVVHLVNLLGVSTGR